MKKLQKGSTAVTALIIVLLVVVALGVYAYVHRAKAPEAPVVSQPDTTAPVVTQTPAATAPALPPHATPSPIAKVYTDKTFGFSTTYPKTLTASVDKKGDVTLFTAGSGFTPTTIVRVTDSADTSTGKWGKNVLSYNPKSGWVTQLQNAQDGSIYMAATVPFGKTDSGLPIFTGGTHHGFGSFTYVVALSQTKFLIITGPEGVTTPTGYDLSTDLPLQIAKATVVSN